MEFIKSQKGKDLMTYNGFIYSTHSKSATTTYWVCTKYRAGKCRARCQVTDGEITTTGHHNHTANAAELQVRTRVTSMKAQAKSTQDLPCQIIAHCVNNAPISVASNLPNSKLMSRAINYARRKESCAPANPISLTELEIPAKYTRTSSDEVFLLANLGTEERILIFSTVAHLKVLSESSRWHCDGTFKCVPHLFTQLYSIHAVMNGSTYPLVYALLPNKTEATYIRFFEELILLATGNNFILRPQLIMSDFEAAFINAASKCFNGVEQKGCYFHFSQCLWRRIQQEPGIVKRYNEDSEFALSLRQVAALAFVPVDDVLKSFELLTETEFFVENETLLQPFMDYFEDNWIGRPQSRRRQTRRKPTFDVNLWNTFAATTEDSARTNNSVEGWHRRFVALIGSHHPSLWKFIEKLKEEHAHTTFLLNQATAGTPPPQKRRKYRDLDQRLLNVVQNFGNISLNEYLTGISCNLSYNV